MATTESASSERRTTSADLPWTPRSLESGSVTAESLPSADRRSGGIQMPELRQNFFTKEWVIMATERAKRPEELATHRVVQPIPVFVESCPFCPGNESNTPAEVLRFPVSGGPWAVRVIPNKFAALSSDVQPT